MNIKRLIQGIATALILMPIIASAAGSGWYIAADEGHAHFADIAVQTNPSVFKIGLPVGFVSSSASTQHSAFRLTGGYQFNQYWGLEASYVSLGQATINDNFLDTVGAAIITAEVQNRAHGWVLAGTGTYPFNDQWSVFARIGAIDGYLEQDLSIIVNGCPGCYTPIPTSASGTAWKATYGVGVNWSFANHWIVRLGWDQYRNLGNSNTTGEYTVNLDSIGIVYRF